MNARDYRLHVAGYQAAAGGAGLSDSPHGGRDGDLWRGGVRSWLDEHPNQDGEDPDAGGLPLENEASGSRRRGDLDRAHIRTWQEKARRVGR